MDGAPATGDDSGGGSGGTIVINTPVLEGHGEITANGGKGTGQGGGGAGGRIFIEVDSYVFYIPITIFIASSEMSLNTFLL